MNRKFKLILTNFSYTLTSNLVSMVISTIIILIVPKLIGVTDYGYWQIYLFYTAYLGFFGIGWIDGIYLRYGGLEYSNLNKNLFSSQFWSFTIYILIVGSLIALYSFLYITDYNEQFIFLMVAFCLISLVPRNFLLYVLQSTNRIKEFSKTTLLERVIYCIFVVVILLIGIRDYKLLIIADMVGKIITLISTVYMCREIVFSKFVSIKYNLFEAKANITTGIKLMFANIASMLIIGVVRFGIERSWNPDVFGKISLTFSISNFFMIFINAIGLVMFPILRRTNESKLPRIYSSIRDLLMVGLFGLLIIYYPFKYTLSLWLPNYSEGLKYMAILFPMCIYEGKMSLLINTYLKTLRKEKLMLWVNLLTLCVSIVITFVTTIIIKSVDLAVLSIVILLAIRCILSETYLSKILDISISKDSVLEFLMTVVFIICSWYITSVFTLLIYGFAYVSYIFIKRKDLDIMLKNIKILVKGNDY